MFNPKWGVRQKCTHTLRRSPGQERGVGEPGLDHEAEEFALLLGGELRCRTP